MADDTAPSAAESLLARAREEGRARLRLYIGAAPGVGKSYQMLEDAHDLKRQGVDVVVGFVEAAFAWHVGFRLMWLVGVLAVLSYLYLRRRVPVAVRRPLWVVAMSQAVAGIVVPAIFGLFFFAAIVGALLLVIMVLVLLGDLRRT